MSKEQSRAARTDAEASTPAKDRPGQDKWAVVIAVILMAIFLTWIGCAIAVYMGWAI